MKICVLILLIVFIIYGTMAYVDLGGFTFYSGVSIPFVVACLIMLLDPHAFKRGRGLRKRSKQQKEVALLTREQAEQASEPFMQEVKIVPLMLLMLSVCYGAYAYALFGKATFDTFASVIFVVSMLIILIDPHAFKGNVTNEVAIQGWREVKTEAKTMTVSTSEPQFDPQQERRRDGYHPFSNLMRMRRNPFVKYALLRLMHYDKMLREHKKKSVVRAPFR